MYTHISYIYIYTYPGYSLVTNFCPGQILVWFLPSFPQCVRFKIKWPFQETTYHFMFSFFKSCWVCPGISAFFPGISALFPGISAQNNRHISMQRKDKKSKISPRGRKYKTDHNSQKNDHLQVLPKKSALRAEILQMDHYLFPFEYILSYPWIYHEYFWIAFILNSHLPWN